MIPARRPSCRLCAGLALTGLLLSGLVAAQSSGGHFRISHEVIAAGGARSAAGPALVTGTVGQAAAAARSSGRFRLSGGFHRPRSIELDDALFRDGFESP